jgi:hypothetical protein
VLDEADRMMDMGFWPDVQKIVSALPPDRQTLLFSATMPGEILKLAREMLRMPTYLQVGANRGAARTIKHSIEQLARADKLNWLASFARHDAKGPVLVFVRTKIGADRVASQLQGKRIARWRCTRTARSRSGSRRSKASARASTPCWSPPTSPRAASTSRASRTSSTSRCPTRRNLRAPRRPHRPVGRGGPCHHARLALTNIAPGRRWRNAVGLQLQ